MGLDELLRYSVRREERFTVHRSQFAVHSSLFAGHRSQVAIAGA